jgi:hypothetical protein
MPSVLVAVGEQLSSSQSASLAHDQGSRAARALGRGRDLTGVAADDEPPPLARPPRCAPDLLAHVERVAQPRDRVRVRRPAVLGQLHARAVVLAPLRAVAREPLGRRRRAEHDARQLGDGGLDLERVVVLAIAAAEEEGLGCHPSRFLKWTA